MKKRKYLAGGSFLGDLGQSLTNNGNLADQAVYGNALSDPTMNLIDTISGKRMQDFKKQMYSDLNYDISAVDTDTAMNRFTNEAKRNYYLNTNNHGALSHILGNLAASAQGASNGLSFGPWGALFGGIAGGALNLVSQTLEPMLGKKVSSYINNYYNAQSNIRQAFIDNMNKAGITAFNSQYKKLGGPLNTHGGDFSNGLFEISNGGTHEENPYEGVPMGVDNEGTPNLVEEGEWVWNDYVFSNRMDVPEEVSKKFKLGGKVSFADAVDKIQKESEERPNDPISKRGLNAQLSELAMVQEVIRMQEEQQKQEEMHENIAAYAADGGPIHIAKSKRGTFTAAATKHNMGVQQFASHVLANKDDYSPAMVKKANFARNASKWKHAYGGNLFAKGGPYEDYFTSLPDYAKAYNAAMDMIYPYRNSNVNPNWNSPLRAAAPREYPKELSYEPYNVRVNRLPSDEDLDNSYEYDLSDIPDLNNAVQKAYNDSQVEKAADYVKTQKALPTWMRYTPIAGALFSLSNNLQPVDYSDADRIENETRAINPYPGYKPLYGHISPMHVDKNAVIADTNAQRAADIRAINDLTNANNASKRAALIALSSKYNNSYGDMLAKIAEINNTRDIAAEQFNFGVQSANAQLAAQAQREANEARRMRLSGLAQTSALRTQLDAARSAAVSDAKNALIESLRDVGNENVALNMANTRGGKFTYGDLKNILQFLGNIQYNSGACGGKLRKVTKR